MSLCRRSRPCMTGLITEAFLWHGHQLENRESEKRFLEGVKKSTILTTETRRHRGRSFHFSSQCLCASVVRDLFPNFFTCSRNHFIVEDKVERMRLWGK